MWREKTTTNSHVPIAQVQQEPLQGHSHLFSHPMNKFQESHHFLPVAPISKIPQYKYGHTYVHKNYPEARNHLPPTPYWWVLVEETSPALFQPLVLGPSLFTSLSPNYLTGKMGHQGLLLAG